MKSPAKRNPAELLFEIGCEEIPAGMLPKAEEDLRVNIEKLLAAEDLSKEATVETFSTPRRLTAWVRGLPYKQVDVEFEVTGPPKSVAYDAVGAPTRAALSFAEKQRVHVSSLYLVQTPKGEYLAAKQVKVGLATEQILTAMLPRAVHDLTWPRSMTWTGLSGPRFIRPIRWVVAVYGGKPLKVAVGGIAAGNSTRGHRFLGSAAIRVSSFQDYEKKLQANGVIVRPARRQEKIGKELEGFANRGGYRIHEDSGLRTLVTHLNEYPTVIHGDFDPAFLNLPDEILISVMRDHQKYFAVEKKNGELAPQFLAVINSGKDTTGIIREGHERVLRARLPTPGSFGRPTRNVGSPTISRSSSALRTNPAWAATGTKWSASGISRAGLPSSGSTSGCTRRMSRKPTVPPSWRSAISRPKWFANSRNSRASSAAFTRVRRASLTRSPMPSMTITARLAWTIQSREI